MSGGPLVKNIFKKGVGTKSHSVGISCNDMNEHFFMLVMLFLLIDRKTVFDLVRLLNK